MSGRRLPVRPGLPQLRIQAKELLRDMPGAKLADAQFALARSYDAPNWPRLVESCELIDAIWRDDVAAVERLITRNPKLIHEPALIRENSWGPPMSYAANLGRNAIIELLHGRGATDLDHALDRAVLQGRIDTARLLHRLRGAAPLPPEPLIGPAYTLSADGTALMFELGAAMDPDAVHVVLETDSRKPDQKHAILEMYVAHGFALPDTAPMAVHRGRIDLLEAHLRRDPQLLARTLAHEEIFPPDLGCHDEILATHGTPLKGATLLHMAIDYDEEQIARWLLAKGMSANVRAAVDEEGFGGHTPLFATVVSQPNYKRNLAGAQDDAVFTTLLLDHGADPNARASLRKQLHPGYGEQTLHEYRDVTPLAWGERFHDQRFVSRAAMHAIEKRGGGR
jgi:hypothetical protein